MARVVRLILVDDDGAPLGALPDIDIEDPWWPEVGDIVTVARERFGVDLFVLRLVDAQGGEGMTGGLVSYTAEAMGPTPPLVPALEDLPYERGSSPGAVGSSRRHRIDRRVGGRGAAGTRNPSHRPRTPGEDLEPVIRSATADGTWRRVVQERPAVLRA